MFNNIHSARGSTKKTGLRVFNKVLGTNPINYRERHRYYTSHDCACPCRDSWPNNRDACGAGIVAAFCHCAQSYKAFFKKRPNGCRPPNRPIAWQCRFKHWLFKRRSVKTENALESRRPKAETPDALIRGRQFIRPSSFRPSFTCTLDSDAFRFGGEPGADSPPERLSGNRYQFFYI